MDFKRISLISKSINYTFVPLEDFIVPGADVSKMPYSVRILLESASLRRLPCPTPENSSIETASSPGRGPRLHQISGQWPGGIPRGPLW